MKVLFLCHGNVNRSPAGEIILKKIKPEWEVKSAALKICNGGQITAKNMRDALNYSGYPTEGIRSSAASQELIDWADVIFYMDTPNEQKLKARFGEVPKAIRISNLINIPKIPDPAFAKGNELHKKVITMLELALKRYIDELPT